MLRLTSLFAIIGVASSTAAAEDLPRHAIGGLTIEAPIGYTLERTEHANLGSEALKFANGPTEEEIAALIEAGELTAEDAALFKNVTAEFPVRTLQVSVIDIPHDAIRHDLSDQDRDTDIYERFGGGFINRWGGDSFCHVHERAVATTCINTLGAIVAVHTRLIDQKLVSVEAMDFVAFRMLDGDALSGPNYDALSALERLQLLSDVVLKDEALLILSSAEIRN